MKVPGTYKRPIVADGRELIETAYERGRVVAMGVAIAAYTELHGSPSEFMAKMEDLGLRVQEGDN